MNVEHDFSFKIILLGDSFVGKTSLIERFLKDEFNSVTEETIGVDVKFTTIDVNGKTVKLLIWDSAGKKCFQTIISCHYRGLNGIIVVFDVTSRESFENLNERFRLIDHNADENACKILVGNKCDLKERRVVQYAEAKEFADRLGISFFETSAENSTNVEKLFMEIVAQLISRVSS